MIEARYRLQPRLQRSRHPHQRADKARTLHESAQKTTLSTEIRAIRPGVGLEQAKRHALYPLSTGTWFKEATSVPL
ncbi:protein of unknown function [Candidatus Filomicrobium marinum]|uniref:Uncharacterized protein n=1 Tax=Candidatus Filomicrobium marinum TaxID=1608628 RepID=A0A0D6JIT4_9HYPH|nr:protein of unknown function [Candidatus Filomicrobium marinum]